MIEMIEDRPTLVIYHANCADGFSAAWCFHNDSKTYGNAYDFYPGVYGESPPDCTGRNVILVDFSYKRAVVEEMLKTANNVILIDHHKTAIDDLASLDHENFYRYIDLERSGAMLAWDYLYNQGLPEDERHRPPLLLDYIQDRDLWKFKFSITRDISAAVFSYEYTFENWDILMSGGQAELLKLTVAGAAIERKHYKDIAELLKICARTFTIGDYNVPTASLPYTMSSDACHTMAKAHRDGTEFAACYWDTDTHRIFSLRSTTNGMDVSAIAATYGGGGHKHAAGFRVHRSHPLAQC